MTPACRIAMLLSLVGLNGCATVMDGHTQVVTVQAVNSSTLPVAASCVVSNKQGSWPLTTPGPVTVDRGRGKLTVACTAPGYLPASTTVVAQPNGDEQGNLIIGGAIGTIVDYSDGAAYQYPSEIYVPMRQAPPVAPVAAAPAGRAGT